MSPVEHVPGQTQSHQPGSEGAMDPAPEFAPPYKGAGRLEGKAVLITGGDSGIGRAVAAAMANEGADIAIVYLEENDDAEATKAWIEKAGRRCVTIAGDIGDEAFCKEAAKRAVDGLGRIDILVNNAAEQHAQESILDISGEQLERTFRTNVFGYFYMTKAVLPHLKEGSRIINTTSVTAYKGNPTLLDYSSTRGAIVAFTRGLANQLADKKIAVNGVAPGPIWTPFIPATFGEEGVEGFGENVPLGRPGQPYEVAACHLFLALPENSYMSGQVLHPNGGTVVGG